MKKVGDIYEVPNEDGTMTKMIVTEVHPYYYVSVPYVEEDQAAANQPIE